MPVVAESRKHLSELIKGVAAFECDAKVNYNYATVSVRTVSGTADVDPIGTLVVWDNANSAFVPYVAQDISAVTGSPLPDASPVAITVGTQEGVGFNKADAALTTTPISMTVLFRGPAAVTREGYETAGIGAGDLDEFDAQMEKQGVAVVASAETVVPSFVTA